MNVCTRRAIFEFGFVVSQGCWFLAFYLNKKIEIPRNRDKNRFTASEKKN